jgi:eukaryotic-like serine/threonine-protein kinase
MVGRYRIVESGPDPAGHTYRATSVETGRPVIVTFLAPLAPAAERGFDLRAGQLIKLRHPGIASMLAYGVESGSPYVVHEQVAGQPLSARLERSEPLSPEPMSLLRQVAAALDFAHNAGVVHGDLQPEVVLLNVNGDAILTELGVASLLERAGAAGGSSAYRAPEQARSGVASAAADRYSFAALASVLIRKMGPAERGGGELDAVLIRGLGDDPSSRWPSCTAMVEAMTGAMQAPIPRARPRSRLGLWIAIAGVALVSLFALLLVLSRPPSEPSTAGVAAATMTLSRGTVPAGTSLVVSGANLPPHQAGQAELQSRTQVLATFTADQSGGFSVTAPVPADTTVGDHTLAVCWNNACPLKQALTVAPPLTSPSPSSSPSPSPSPTPSPSPSSVPGGASPTASP